MTVPTGNGDLSISNFYTPGGAIAAYTPYTLTKAQVPYPGAAGLYVAGNKGTVCYTYDTGSSCSKVTGIGAANNEEVGLSAP